MILKRNAFIQSALAISVGLGLSVYVSTSDAAQLVKDHDYSVMEELINKNDPAYDYTVGTQAIYVSAETGSDDNDGSEGAPFASVQHALSQAKGGEVIYVMNGDYGDLRFGAKFSDKKVHYAAPIKEVFTDWVTLKAMEGHHPTFDHVTLGTAHDDGGWYSIKFSEEGNSDLRLRIDGFRIRNNMQIRGSRYVDIRNCKISRQGDFANMTLDEKNEYIQSAGIQVFNGKHIKLLYNEITDTGVGIWAMTRDLVVKGNHIHHLTHDGIQFHGGEDWLVENNIIHDLDDGMSDEQAAEDDDVKKVNMHVDGIHMYIINAGSETYARRLDNVTVRGNLFYHLESMDVMVNGTPEWIAEQGGGYGKFTIENNIFAPSNGTMFLLGSGFDSMTFRHNTVLYTPNDQYTSVWGREFGQTFNNPKSNDYYMQTWWDAAILKYTDRYADYYFYNNVMMNVGKKTWTSGGQNINAHMNVYYNPGQEEKTLDNNAGYATGISPYIQIDGSLQDYLDSGQIPGLAPVEHEDTSLTYNHGYTEQGIEAYPTDFAGKERGEHPDIGAVELF